MKVKIHRIDDTLPLPEYQTKGSVAFDLYARVDTHIPAGEIALIPTNLIIETPPGYMLVSALRSSTPKRKGLIIPHGIGIVDQDYCGPEDELLVQVYNISGQEVIVGRGERIGQGLFVRIDKAEWEEGASSAQTESRGGVGSTGY